MNPSAHDVHMRRCLELARQALTAGDTPVGAVVVENGRSVGEGVESVRARCDVTAHAEIVAVRHASASLGSRDLSSCTLYTTVEPCVMCAYAIRLARIPVVVAGTRGPGGPRPLEGATVLERADVLPSRPPALLIRGVLEDECLALLSGERPPDVAT